MLLGFFPLCIHPQPQHTPSIPFDPKPNLALSLFLRTKTAGRDGSQVFARKGATRGANPPRDSASSRRFSRKVNPHASSRAVELGHRVQHGSLATTVERYTYRKNYTCQKRFFCR